jgi:hypothetical protein
LVIDSGRPPRPLSDSSEQDKLLFGAQFHFYVRRSRLYSNKPNNFISCSSTSVEAANICSDRRAGTRTSTATAAARTTTVRWCPRSRRQRRRRRKWRAALSHSPRRQVRTETAQTLVQVRIHLIPCQLDFKIMQFSVKLSVGVIYDESSRSQRKQKRSASCMRVCQRMKCCVCSSSLNDLQPGVNGRRSVGGVTN